MQIVANVTDRCARSTTGGNLKRIQLDTNLDPWCAHQKDAMYSIPKAKVGPENLFRVQYLRKLIDARLEARSRAEETDALDDLINSLCSS